MYFFIWSFPGKTRTGSLQWDSGLAGGIQRLTFESTHVPLFIRERETFVWLTAASIEASIGESINLTKRRHFKVKEKNNAVH